MSWRAVRAKERNECAERLSGIRSALVAYLMQRREAELLQLAGAARVSTVEVRRALSQLCTRGALRCSGSGAGMVYKVLDYEALRECAGGGA